MIMEKDTPVPEAGKYHQLRRGQEGCEVCAPEASMSMSVTGGTEWSEGHRVRRENL
jgi:hypothetical protein